MDAVLSALFDLLCSANRFCQAHKHTYMRHRLVRICADLSRQPLS